MSDFFMTLLELSIISSFLILIVFALRGLFFKKVPKWTLFILWALVGIKLLVPITIESEYAVIPKISLEKDSLAHVEDTSLDTSFETTTSLDTSFDTTTSLDTSFDATTSFDSSFDATTSYDTNLSTNFETDSEEFSPIIGIGGTFSQLPSTEEVSSNPSENIVSSRDESKNVFKIPLFSHSTAKICIIVWLVGFAFMLTYGTATYVRLKRKVSVFSVYNNRIRKCESIETPFVLGIIKPYVYLPFGLSEEAEKHIIAHEIAHIERFDYISKIVAFIALSVHWFNPLVWIAFSLFCKDIEYACDEKVLRTLDADEKKGYAKALLECSIKGTRIAACPVSFGEVGVKGRVKNVFSYKKPLTRIITTLVLISITLAFVFLTSFEGNAKGIENSASQEAYSEDTLGNESSVAEDSVSSEISNEDKDTSDNKSSIIAEETNIQLYAMTGVKLVNSNNNTQNVTKSIAGAITKSKNSSSQSNTTTYISNNQVVSSGAKGATYNPTANIQPQTPVPNGIEAFYELQEKLSIPTPRSNISPYSYSIYGKTPYNGYIIRW